MRVASGRVVIPGLWVDYHTGRTCGTCKEQVDGARTA